MKTAGLFRAASNSRWRRRRLAILTYHGVSIEDEHAWNPGLYLSPERFRDTLEVIRRANCEVLPLRQAVDRLYAGDLPSRAVALTFDDGNFDFSARAVPILAEFGYPATVFVSTYYSDLQQPVFNPTIRYVLWKARSCSLDAAELAVGNEPLLTKEASDRDRSFARICQFAEEARLSGDGRGELLTLLAERLDVDLEALTAARMFHLMNAAELAALPTELVDVQLHTHRHRTPRDRDLFLKELADNRFALSRALGQDRRLDQFCYPFGDYVPEFVPWLEQAGVELAVTCDRGLASAHSHRMLLRRVMMTSALSDLKLESWLTGVLELLPLRRSK